MPYYKGLSQIMSALCAAVSLCFACDGARAQPWPQLPDERIVLTVKGTRIALPNEPALFDHAGVYQRDGVYVKLREVIEHTERYRNWLAETPQEVAAGMLVPALSRASPAPASTAPRQGQHIVTVRFGDTTLRLENEILATLPSVRGPASKRTITSYDVKQGSMILVTVDITPILPRNSACRPFGPIGLRRITIPPWGQRTVLSWVLTAPTGPTENPRIKRALGPPPEGNLFRVLVIEDEQLRDYWGQWMVAHHHRSDVTVRHQFTKDVQLTVLYPSYACFMESGIPIARYLLDVIRLRFSSVAPHGKVRSPAVRENRFGS